MAAILRKRCPHWAKFLNALISRTLFLKNVLRGAVKQDQKFRRQGLSQGRSRINEKNMTVSPNCKSGWHLHSNHPKMLATVAPKHFGRSSTCVIPFLFDVKANPQMSQ